MEKVGQEVANYRAFLRLGAELAEVNEQICQVRPAMAVTDESELEELKKKTAEAVRQEVEQEVNRIMSRVFQDRQRRGHLDLEASEMAVRASMPQRGGGLLEKLLNADGGGYRGARIDCGQGHQAEFVEDRAKEVITVLSPVVVLRAYDRCPVCQRGVSPKDQELDIVGTSFSPGVRPMMARVGGKEPFEAVVASMRRLRPREEKAQEEVRKAIEYFQTNAERMRYARFRSQGLFVGSGVVEAGCKTIVGQRLKQSGMRWTVRGANAIIALRCCQLSGRWEEFWEGRSVG